MRSDRNVEGIRSGSEGSPIERKIVGDLTYEQRKVNEAHLPWKGVEENKERIYPREFKSYFELLNDSRILALKTEYHSHYVIDSWKQVNFGELGIEPNELGGMVVYGFALRMPLPNVETDYFAYFCNACNVLSFGAPRIQAITERSDPIETMAIGKRLYAGQKGIIYTCGNCNRDMLVRLVKDPVLKKHSFKSSSTGGSKEI